MYNIFIFICICIHVYVWQFSLPEGVLPIMAGSDELNEVLRALHASAAEAIREGDDAGQSGGLPSNSTNVEGFIDTIGM